LLVTHPTLKLDEHPFPASATAYSIYSQIL